MNEAAQKSSIVSEINTKPFGNSEHELMHAVLACTLRAASPCSPAILGPVCR
jgi:hypothetical protein